MNAFHHLPICTFLWLVSFPMTAQKFQFALIGDMPYQEVDVQKFERLIDDLNGDRKIKWVMHTGDIKTGSTPCTDDYFTSRYHLYQQIQKPFIITPGDNEWTDCHREACGGYAPLERLEVLRRIFYKNPLQSMGQKPMPLESQSSQESYQEFPEHQRWEKNGVWFVTCHIVGSANAMAPFEGRTATNDEESVRRTQAAIAWMNETFEKAKNDRGVFIMIHANPKLEKAGDKEATKGFYDFLEALEKAVVNFGKPVVLAHGDSHYFRYDKPLISQKSERRIENFTRLECFGASDIHWVRVVVNPKDPNLFQIRQELVEANFENHR